MPIVAVRFILPDLEFGGVEEVELTDVVVMAVPCPLMIVTMQARLEDHTSKHTQTHSLKQAWRGERMESVNCLQ